MRLTRLVFNTTTMMVFVLLLIIIFGGLLAYTAIYGSMDVDRLEIIVPVLAVLTGYLISTGTQISRDRVDRAKQFVEARRNDESFREAADHTWRRIREVYGENPKQSIPVITSVSDDILRDVATVADIYEEMAILIKYNHVDEDLLYDYFGNPVIRFFAFYSVEILQFRTISFEYDGLKVTTAAEYIELEWLYKRWLPRYNSWVKSLEKE